jgi:hypothetical protein
MRDLTRSVSSRYRPRPPPRSPRCAAAGSTSSRCTPRTATRS